MILGIIHKPKTNFVMYYIYAIVPQLFLSNQIQIPFISLSIKDYKVEKYKMRKKTWVKNAAWVHNRLCVAGQNIEHGPIYDTFLYISNHIWIIFKIIFHYLYEIATIRHP